MRANNAVTHFQTDQTIMAYQIAFDLYENATQQFLSSVNEKLRIAIPMITDAGEDQEKNKVMHSLNMLKNLINFAAKLTTMSESFQQFVSEWG